MSKAVSVRLEPLNRKGFGGQRQHNIRSGRIPGYVDQDRISLNSAPIPDDTLSSVLDDAEKRRQDAGLSRLRVDARVAYTGIVTFGTEAQPVIEALQVAEQDRLYSECARQIADHLGTDVRGVAVHRDESAPHAHFTLSAVREDGRALRLQPRDLSQLQDIAAKVYKDAGLERGKRYGERIAAGEDYSKTIHRSVKQLHTDLPAELDAKQQKLDQVTNRLRAASEKREAAEAQLEAAQDELAESQNRLTSLRASEGTLKSTLEKAVEDTDKAEKAAEIASQEAERLKKREATYSQRLDKKTADYQALKKKHDSLADLVAADKTFPKAKKTTITEKRPFFGKAKTKTLTYITPDEAQAWRGSLLGEKDEADKKARSYKRTAKKSEDVVNSLNENSVANQYMSRYQLAKEVSDATLENRYGVILQVSRNAVRVPPRQEPPPSAKQVASALYRSARSNFKSNSTLYIDVKSEQVAKEMIKMASEDDTLELMTFKDPIHNNLLYQSVISNNEFKSYSKNKELNQLLKINNLGTSREADFDDEDRPTPSSPSGP